ncbi:MAG TPA: sulfite exporter TauE/SafE family protein [Pseudogracilibacillus sp.]|nr:sulfite exporter TauE/SafE family protein [Pseudogracilibacillus sp.]
MNATIFFIFIILIAAVLQTSTGFGFSIISTPFMLLIMEPREAVQISLILSLVISFSLVGKVKKDVDKGILKRFTVGSIVGLPIGMIIFLLLSVTWLKIGIGVLILLLTALLILHVRIKQTSRRDVVIGGASGALTSSIGMSGPPILLYFSGTNTTKEKLRGTTLIYYIFICFMSLMTQMIVAGTTSKVWLLSALSLPLIVIGLFLGQYMFMRINQSLFRRLTYALLLFTGVNLLVQQL